jgi:hypothetical protein
MSMLGGNLGGDPGGSNLTYEGLKVILHPLSAIILVCVALRMKIGIF